MKHVIQSLTSRRPRAVTLPYLRHAVGADSGAVDFDFVGIHRRVCDEDFRILDALRLADADLLVENKSLSCV